MSTTKNVLDGLPPWDVAAAIVFRLDLTQLKGYMRQVQDPRWNATPDILCRIVNRLFQTELPEHIQALDGVWERRQALLDQGECATFEPNFAPPTDVSQMMGVYYDDRVVPGQRVVGLRGKKGAGKSTVASVLVHEMGFREVSFADALKDMCRFVFLLTGAQVYDPDEKECADERWFHTTPREIMQVVGTDLFREALPRLAPGVSVGEGGVWVKNTTMRIRQEPRVVISDVRFPNEQEFIHARRGTVVEVVRDTPRDARFTTHVSETALDEISPDAFLFNHSTVEDLRKATRAIFATDKASDSRVHMTVAEFIDSALCSGCECIPCNCKPSE